MRKLTLALLVAMGTLSTSFPMLASATVEPETSVDNYQYSDAELDSLLAPIALYPDTLLTHIMIAATYPLDVVAADRWRQSNLHLTPEQIEQALDPVTWDPSVKALAAFTDILHTMAEDLNWLQALGDNVLISEARVLDRVQLLRQHALNTGNLQSNDYLEVEREIEQERSVIVIAPRHRDVVYVPYYDPLIVFGLWSHAIAPVHWHHRVSYRHRGNFFWAPQVRLSSFFYFGGIRWSNRHVVIHREPVRHYYRGTPNKRVYSKGYQRWQHNADHRRARYSNRVVHSAPKRYSATRSVKVRSHERGNTRVINAKSSRHTQTSVSQNNHRNIQHNNQLKGQTSRNVNVANKQLKTPRTVTPRHSTTTRTVTTTKTVKRESNKASGQKYQQGASTHVKRTQTSAKNTQARDTRTASNRPSMSQQRTTRNVDRSASRDRSVSRERSVSRQSNVNRNRSGQSKSHSQK
ncbi:DUF3300 domain-containing protein [Alteromonas sp. CI.11.F.A3]|uniref:DUF3300 domain-containing protein n=1 Tax=Alteromonas sp. CI.11.F.A3 TaxID=3079555 RepID=UPI0029425DC7|nr:DUF3300 domain-containing protein [Alteromonas sp. CI.11.F.A3]WOI37387.1 DUF3300 domain-containing protein [Alteromonas sp. CI.11.F.A3]